MPWGKRGINIVIPSVIWQPRLQVEATLQEMPENEIILDVGAGGRKISDSVRGVDFLLFPILLLSPIFIICRSKMNP